MLLSRETFKLDDIMADRGFDIESEMPVGLGLNIPPFLNGALNFH